MVMEVCCGQCNGRLLIETPGVVVACPHCGVHLSIPLPDEDPEGSPSLEAIGDPHAVSSEPDSVPAQHSNGGVVAANPDAGNPSGETIGEAVSSNAPPSPESNPAPTSSIFGGPEDEQPGSDRSSDPGWHSSPNLALSDTPPLNSSPQPPAAAVTPSAPVAPTECTVAGQQFSWMANAMPAAGTVPTPLVTPQSPVSDESAASAVEHTPADEFGWPSSPNLSLTPQAETTPATPQTASPTMPPASSAPDFSWMASADTGTAGRVFITAAILVRHPARRER